MKALQLTDSAPPTEWSAEFLQGMLDRMAVSFHKYGPVAEAYPDKVNALKSCLLRVDKYRETGNTEFLVDAANFLMIEFLCPSVAGAGFHATDADASPGRVWQPDEIDGFVEISQRANDLS